MILKLIIAAVLTGLISGFFITFYELLITFTFFSRVTPMRPFRHCRYGIFMYCRQLPYSSLTTS